LFENSSQCKNSFVREYFESSALNAEFIRGNLSVLSLDLAHLETLSLKDIIALNSLLKKYKVHAALFSGKFQSILSLVSIFSIVANIERRNLKNNLKTSSQVEVINSIQGSRIDLQKTLRSSLYSLDRINVALLQSLIKKSCKNNLHFILTMVTRLNKNPIIAFGSTHAVDYPTPINLSYFWGFGFLAITMLVIQILTGVFLAMH